jgi:hypothetical protein
MYKYIKDIKNIYKVGKTKIILKIQVIIWEHSV